MTSKLVLILWQNVEIYSPINIILNIYQIKILSNTRSGKFGKKIINIYVFSISSFSDMLKDYHKTYQIHSNVL